MIRTSKLWRRYGAIEALKGIDLHVELVDLTGKEGALIDTLSRGMQQRLGLARTLVHDPKVLILDEPASGLDPRARIEIREILKELSRMGKTILLSSHIRPRRRPSPPRASRTHARAGLHEAHAGARAVGRRIGASVCRECTLVAMMNGWMRRRPHELPAARF